MLTQSELTGKFYDDMDAVFFRNLRQSIFYLKNNCYPIDMFLDSEDKIVMVFDKQQHKKVLKLWIANKDENKEDI